MQTHNTPNKIYQSIIKKVYSEGEVLETRNHSAISYTDNLAVKLEKFPLVTVRKTAWKKALLEMEWFMSGYGQCPEELQDWWKGQLNPDGYYIDGYGLQLRNFSKLNGNTFDQILWLIRAIKEHPNSRRLIITTWNPAEMAEITERNQNPNTPTTCHLSFVQFFVRDGVLSMKDYARSQDLLLGTPHNWVQHWALLLYLAHHTGLKPGHITYIFGDAHIYNEPSHINTANAIINSDLGDGIGNGIGINIGENLELVYTPSTNSYEFLAKDFEIKGKIAEPIVSIRPKLL
jgi:thymidylate synthase